MSSQPILVMLYHCRRRRCRSRRRRAVAVAVGAVAVADDGVRQSGVAVAVTSVGVSHLAAAGTLVVAYTSPVAMLDDERGTECQSIKLQ